MADGVVDIGRWFVERKTFDSLGSRGGFLFDCVGSFRGMSFSQGFIELGLVVGDSEDRLKCLGLSKKGSKFYSQGRDGLETIGTTQGEFGDAFRDRLHFEMFGLAPREFVSENV